MAFLSAQMCLMHQLLTLQPYRAPVPQPENFLLTDETESATLKAIDFGLSVFFKVSWHCSC